MANKSTDLAHTKWLCKYHIVFTPKYRRKIIYNQYKEDLRDILKQLCSYKGVEIMENNFRKRLTFDPAVGTLFYRTTLSKGSSSG